MGIQYKIFIYLLDHRIFALPSTPSTRYLQYGMYDEEPDASYSSNPITRVSSFGHSCVTMLQLTRLTRFYSENRITVLSLPPYSPDLARVDCFFISKARSQDERSLFDEFMSSKELILGNYITTVPQNEFSRAFEQL